jgi:hypothetical protein
MRIDKWNFSKLKSFCVAKETINTMNKHPTEWQKNFASYSSMRTLISKEVNKPNNKKEMIQS